MSVGSYIGCIIGKAVGDALGFPVEGGDPFTCSQYAEKIRNREPVDKPFNYQPGQYTDDTQLARELMISLVNCKKFVPHDYAGRIANIFLSNNIVGRGMATEQAANNLINGISWEKAGTPGPSAGNGTAMRSAPIGLFYSQDHNVMLETAAIQSQITHLDARCTAGSVIMAASVAFLMNSPHNDLIDHLLTFSADYSYIFTRDLGYLKDWIKLEPEEAVLHISNSGNPDFTDQWSHISPYVIPSVLWSLYSFIKNPNNFLDAVTMAIQVGGDVDTTAAMTGALSGTYLGVDAIPQRYKEIIHDKGEWKFDDLKDLTLKLIEVSENKL